MSDCWVSKIDLDLHIKPSRQLSKLMFAPLIHVLLLEQSLSDLNLHVSENSSAHIVIHINSFIFLNKLLKEILRLFDVSLEQLAKVLHQLYALEPHQMRLDLKGVALPSWQTLGFKIGVVALPV